MLYGIFYLCLLMLFYLVLLFDGVECYVVVLFLGSVCYLVL